MNGAGWAVGAPLTSAQQNQLDIDHANALDKSAAGDTLLGVVTIAGGGAQLIGNSANAIESTFTSGITTNVAGGISSQAPSGNGIILRGTTTEQLGVFPARTRTLIYPCSILGAVTSPWTTQQTWIIGNATTAVQYLMLPLQHNRATLSTVTVTLIVQGPHGSLPAALPTIGIRRISPIFGWNGIPVELSTTAVQSPTPATAAAWDDAGNAQQWTYVCNQNNVIDTTQFVYYAYLTDESGANSVAGNKYYGLTLSYSNIADLGAW